MVRLAIGTLVVLGLITWGTWKIVDWAYDTDVRNANAYCESLGATPRYTHRTRYICVTPDGRIVE